MVFEKNRGMDRRREIQVDLIKLVGGERLLRMTYGPLGLALEKKLDPDEAVVRQKNRLFAVFEVALAKAELSAA
jgi:hypothetical protein